MFFCTLPFGWKTSAYIYHNLGLAVSSSARSYGAPVSQYIDDRHVGQLFSHATEGRSLVPDNVRAEAGAYILCYLLIEAGYFVNIDKSSYLPSTSVRFLGFLCDSTRQAFILPADKRQKFASLREEILSTRLVSIKALQRFAGKAISFSLAVPGCKLYVREIFKAISHLSRTSRHSVRVEGDLREEIASWRFLDDWSEYLVWRPERHLSVSIFSDASLRAWGAVLHKDGTQLVSRDYWPPECDEDIGTLESKALLNALLAFREQIRNSRVDVHVDNLVLKSALDNDGCKNSDMNNTLKDIYQCCREGNFSIHAFHVPSADNPADKPSRTLSDIDCSLNTSTWQEVERFFGPHSFDLMSLDSNCQKDRHGAPLPHFTPWSTPESSGVNAFSKPLPPGQNVYVFPPFMLVGPLIRYIIDQGFEDAFTLVAPDLQPRRFWWALLQAFAVDQRLLGRKGSPSVLLFPCPSSRKWVQRPLPWDLWAFRCMFC